jgi:hypothetical protein
MKAVNRRKLKAERGGAERGIRNPISLATPFGVAGQAEMESP